MCIRDSSHIDDQLWKYDKTTQKLTNKKYLEIEGTWTLPTHSDGQGYFCGSLIKLDDTTKLPSKYLGVDEGGTISLSDTEDTGLDQWCKSPENCEGYFFLNFEFQQKNYLTATDTTVNGLLVEELSPPEDEDNAGMYVLTLCT